MEGVLEGRRELLGLARRMWGEKLAEGLIWGGAG